MRDQRRYPQTPNMSMQSTSSSRQYADSRYRATGSTGRQPVKEHSIPHVSIPSFEVRSDMTTFNIEHQVGEGTYGKVFKATRKSTRAPVALKKLYLKEDDKGEKKNRDGFPITAIREIEILKSLRHPNVITLEGMISFSTGIDFMTRCGYTYVYGL